MANARTAASVRLNIEQSHCSSVKRPAAKAAAPRIHAPLHGVVAEATSAINQFHWLNRPAVLIQHE
jgi:hypothetical protein